MKITRTAALLLACCLLSACGPSATASQDTTAPTAGGTTTAAPTTTAEPETTVLSSATQLGEYDFGGETYTILGRDYAKLGTLPDIEFNVETQNGDIINDTIYKRNRTIEEQYKVVINAVKPDGKVVTVVENSQMANDGAYDLVWAHINSMASLSTKGLLADYNSLPVIDITQPWWNQLATESLTVNGRCYLQMNYIPFTGVLLSHCLYYNKAMAKDNGIEDIYSLVKNNEWTFEKFAELSKKVSRDVDGNTVYDAADTYGLVCSHGTAGVGFSVGMDVNRPISKIAADGSFTTQMGTDRTQKVLELIVSLTTDPSTYLITNYKLENDLAKMFANDQALFYSGFLSDSYQFFRNMKSDFGLLPFPKYDTEQENYITTVTGGTGLLGVPKQLLNEKKTGVITEALAIESYTNIYPVIYETVFENKVLRDAESQEMFDILMNGLEIDFGRTYKYGDYAGLFDTLVAAGDTTLASREKVLAKAAQKHYENVIKHFYSE